MGGDDGGMITSMRYGFERCVVDTDTFEVVRDGVPVKVEPQVFEVLAHLLRHRDRLVGREELLDAVWGDRFVSASAVNSRVKAVRQAIDDDGRTQRLVRTVHGRGYRFVGEVHELPPPDEAPAPHVPDTRPGEDGTRPVLASPEPVTVGPGGRSRWPFTGRQDCLELVADAFRRGEGGAILIGPAGVGKTRLADEALAVAEHAGHPVARAVGHAAARQIPLGALAHLLPVDLVADVGIGEDERTALFHAARRQFATMAVDRRMMLFVDDVNLLDDTSVALLVPLVVTRRIFLLGTVRAGDGTPMSSLAGLVRDGHLVRLDLAPLSSDDLRAVLQRALDGAPTERTVAELHRLSGGNLQILAELVRGATEGGALARQGAVWELVGELATTVELDELVAERLAHVDGTGRDVLEALAVCERFGITDLEAEFGPEILDRLEADDLVDIVTSGRRSYLRLAHPLYGDVLAGQLPPVRLRTVRRRLADMVDRHGGRRREDQLRSVLWRLDSGGSVEPERLVRAARAALLGHDPSLARHIVAAVPEDAPNDVRGERSHVLAEASARVGDVAAATSALDSGLALDVSDGVRAQLAIRAADLRFFALRDLDGALRACTEAAARVGDDATRAAIDAHRAVLLATAGRAEEALRVIDALPVELEPRVAVDVAAARAGALTAVGRCTEAAEAARQAAAAHAALPPALARGGSGRHLVNEAHALGYAGHLRAARELLEPAAERARAAGATPAWVWFEMALGEVARDMGRGDEAVRRCAAVVESAAAAGQEAVLSWAHAGVAQGHLLVGRCAEAARAIDRAGEQVRSPVATSDANLERVRAWLDACRGDLAAARTRLLAVADGVRADGVYVFEAGVLHDVARFGDPVAVVGRLGELADELDGPLFVAFAHHASALTADDPAALAACVDELEGIESLALAAEAAAELAAVHARHGRRAEAEAARRRSSEIAARAGGVATPPLVAARGAAG
jgi:DNA-binding winged helix-turn-helix (wHTH) protein